jgi:hypothetical protein
VAAAVTPANMALLHDPLGADASEVTFIGRDDRYQRPATTVAGWQRLLADAVDRGVPQIRPEPMAPVVGRPALAMTIGDTVAPARRALRAAVEAGPWSGSDRLDDLVLAVSEIVANSICHGRGHRELQVWIAEQDVVCEVSDEGSGLSDPLVGVRRPDEVSMRADLLAQRAHVADVVAR